jgi:hypothetical protein
MTINVTEGFTERDAWTGQTAENSSRLAFAWGTFTSTGWGELAYPEPVDFGLTFVEEPIVAYGFALVGGDKLVDNRFPRAQGGVYEWRIDGRGFYIGAHVFACVETVSALITAPYGDPDPNYELKHHFTFSGIALKDIGADRFRDD